MKGKDVKLRMTAIGRTCTYSFILIENNSLARGLLPRLAPLSFLNRQIIIHNSKHSLYFSMAKKKGKAKPKK